jgi:predicted acyl esterase
LQRVAFAGAMSFLALAGSLAAAGTGASGSSAPLPFRGHGSIGQAYVTGAPPGVRLTVVTAAGASAGSGVVDRLGSLIVRNLTPGAGYRFEEGTGPAARRTAAFRVLGTTSTPGASLYSSQHLHAGLNYVRMRDGILLAATVRLPPGKTLADGPFPTVIEYSGYNVAGPHDLIDALEGQASTSDPLLPDTSTVVGSVVAPLLGFVTVSVQMRGTGCSGGAFDLFGLPSDYDGYDVVQTVGAQPWALNHKVGMVGISYSGFSQLVVAGTDPPDLAAITPLSPTDDLYSTGYPGGIYNNGFAAGWVAQRVSDARPAPAGGQPWARAEIATGDTTCLANQRLHQQAQSLDSLISPNLDRTPALFNPRSPTVWAAHIKVPVFLVGALEDEQVGPQWPSLITALHGDKNVYVTMLNGTHTDSLGPDTISRWLEFLDVYVAGRVPAASPTLQALAPTLYKSLTGGAASAPVPAVRFTTEPSVTAAKAAFAAQDPRVRVLFDNGGGNLGPGALQPTYEAGFSAWPPAGSVVRYGLGPDGTLQRSAPRASSTASFHPNPAVRPADDLPASANAWAAQPPYDWTTVPAANGIAFETPALTSATTIVGPASLNLMLRSTAPVTDLQVTVTEVRPGATQEEYVTSGFLRSSDRTLSATSTVLDPVPTYLMADRRPLTRGRFTLVRIPVDPIAHTFRAGTRLRIVISAPGGDRPSWTFDTPATHGSVVDTVALGGSRGSSLVVNEVGAVVPSSATPACGALRGEPCRAYAALGNQG